MSLAPLVGHEDLQRRLRHAVETSRLPQSLLFVGPTGIGKQRLALWLAGLVVCMDADPAARPCGACRSCRLANDLQHPDIHWFFPLPSPRGGSTPAKRREKLEEARHEELAGRRETPVRASSVDTADSIFLAVVEEIRSKASLRPAMGSSTVFVIGDADRMVPQASSPEAANAFLKLLELSIRVLCASHEFLFLGQPTLLCPPFELQYRGKRPLVPPARPKPHQVIAPRQHLAAVEQEIEVIIEDL